MRAVRFASAAVYSCLASCAVLRFEPAATMPLSAAATATAIPNGSNWIAPVNMALRPRRQPSAAIRPAKMNLRQFSIPSASSSIKRKLPQACGHVGYAPEAGIREKGSSRYKICLSCDNKLQWS